jgi:NAD(P)-dependent dehydrogenase (short-subunit alcohol dehydrogenase family)
VRRWRATIAAGRDLGLVARRGDFLRSCKSRCLSLRETYPCDVTDAAALNAAAADFIARHGAPDVVIGNAGVSFGNLTEIAEDVEVFREILEINVLGLVNTFHPFVAPMRAAGRAPWRGLRRCRVPRAARRHGLQRLQGRGDPLSRGAARGDPRLGIRVVTICPGFIAHPMTAKNPYPMPFIIGVEDAARRFARAIDRGTPYAVIPWQMAIVGRLLGVLPNAIFDRVMARPEEASREARG